MNLLEEVRERVLFNGRTPGGCQLVLNNLLDYNRDVFQFIQLFTARDINMFYLKHQVEIDELGEEDQELLTEPPGVQTWVKLALEKCLMQVETEINVSCEG